ncbi:MAG: EAL domain-containing protein [Gammaproteobacteria bacterium]|nr:EAL domain-containing protein [Gammaproteobacteria bacterium]
MKLLSGLRARLLLLAALSLLPVLGLVVYSAMEQRAAAAAASWEKALHLTRFAAVEYAHLINNTRQLLAVLSRLPEMSGSQPSRCQSLLADLQRDYPYYANLGVIDLHGAVVCSALPLSEPVNVADRAYFRRALEKQQFAIGDYQIGRITRKAAVNFGYPAFDENGNVQAVVFTALDLSWLSQLPAKGDLPAEAVLTLLDRSGTILVRHPEPAQWIGKTAPELALAGKELAQKDEVTVEAPGPGNEPHLYTFSRLHTMHGAGDIILAIDTPAHIAYAQVNRTRTRNLGWLGLVTLLAFLAAWRGGDAFILRQVRALTSAAKRLGAGDLRARSGHAPGAGELQQLAASFDEMAGTLERSQQEHVRQQEQLSELNRLYAVLSAINRLILRVQDRRELLEEACQIAVTLGRFRLAWIGLLDGEQGVFKPVAQRGLAQEYLDALLVTLRPAGKADPVDAALSAGRHFMSGDIGHDARLVHWRESAQKYGFRSYAAFPLKTEGRVTGVFNLYAREVNFFDAAEINLLQELTDDLSYALATREREVRHQQVQEKINYLAHHDELTGLPNRALFLQHIGHVLIDAAKQRHLMTVLCLDLDNFKHINDLVGHEAGNTLLKLVAGRLADGMRTRDMVARLSGDEFAIVLTDLKDDNASALVAQKIMNRFIQPLHLHEREIFINLSIGITLFPHDGDDPEELLKNAETAMYQARNQGGNNYQYYSAQMTALVDERMTLGNALRHALERNEICLHYQPQIELATGKITGAEVLLRWQHPDLGEIPPSRFIPIAEQTGLIETLGEWALRSACAQVQAWHKAGLTPLRVAVNLSARQFYQKNLLETITAILKGTGLDPRWLDLELTESIVMQQVEATVDILRALKAMGTSISIDDFGTGYSSLSYLKKFPVDFLKIDRSFISGIPSISDDTALTATIIAMAHSLGIKVVAEGVETEQQAAFLRAHQCDAGQGYYFSKPLPAEEFALLLKREIQAKNH